MSQRRTKDLSPQLGWNAALLEELLEVLFKVVGSYGAFGIVGDGLFAQVVEGEGSGWREAAVSGLIQDDPHQLQRNLRIASGAPLQSLVSP